MSVFVREAREADAPGIARVHVDSWRTTYAGIVPQDYLDGLSVSDRERRWMEILKGGGSGVNCVAESLRDGIVGFSSVGPGRPYGSSGWELYAIYLLQNWQGSGLGHKLFAGALDAAIGEDARAPVFTWCISENPACRFYESLGGKLLGSREIEIGGARLTEVAYGWREAVEATSG